MAGLLAVPEVADVVAMLRLAADPTAGPAALRVLTGPRWRLGARDIAALWRRAVTLHAGDPVPTAGSVAEQVVAQSGPDVDEACLADALSDPGPAEAYSAAGYARIVAVARELTALRAHLDSPLPELVAEVRRVLGVDAEARAARPVTAGWSGTEHLDAFSDVVADYASRPGATVTGMLAYLDTAEEVENGLAPPRSAWPRTASRSRPHAAKGLEWQIVAVPHLSGRVFPSTALPRTWLTDASDLPRCCAATARRCPSTACRYSTPPMSAIGKDCRTRSPTTSAASSSGAPTRSGACCTWRSPGPSRPCWSPGTTGEPPSPSLVARRRSCASSRTSSTRRPRRVARAARSTDGPTRPPTVTPTRCGNARWRRCGRSIPLATRRADTDRGAHLVAQAMSGDLPPAETVDDHGWSADVDALLAERRRAQQRPPVPLPAALSVSTVVDLGRDPEAAVARLQRRLPRRPDAHALLGTAFHEWVQRYFQSDKLFDLDDLPGAVDADRQDDGELEELQAAFAVSPWLRAPRSTWRCRST